MDKQLKNILLGTGFGVVLFVTLTNLQHVLGVLEKVLDLLSPLIIGGIMAFVLNVPMTYLENLLNRIAAKGKKKNNSVRAISLFLTIICILGVVVLLGIIVIPQMARSVNSLISQIEKVWPQWIKVLEREGFDAKWLAQLLNEIKSSHIFEQLQQSVKDIFPFLTGTISSIFSKTFNVVLAFIMMIYLLLDKEAIAGFTTRLLKAYIPDRVSAKVRRTGRLLCDIYADFLSRQCLEAVILGTMVGVSFTVCRLPYGGLVAVLTALLSFVPYVGSFLSCAVGAVIILTVSPMKALVSVVVYQIVQFIENQFVYPRVVGSAVGLPPLLTLLAVFVGGGLFGIFGMIFFIPFTATAYTLLKESVDEHLERKKQSQRELL